MTCAQREINPKNLSGLSELGMRRTSCLFKAEHRLLRRARRLYSYESFNVSSLLIFRREIGKSTALEIDHTSAGVAISNETS